MIYASSNQNLSDNETMNGRTSEDYEYASNHDKNTMIQDSTYEYASGLLHKSTPVTAVRKYIKPDNAAPIVYKKNEPYTPLAVFQVNQYQSHQGDTGDYTNDAKYLTLPELSDYELIYKKPNTKNPSYANLRKIKK